MLKLGMICRFLLLPTLSASLALSQAVSGTLLGTITDATGASVPNAIVTITEVNTGIVRSTKTSEAGNFNFGDLPPGTYSVTVELTGFKKALRTNVDVLVNSSVRVDLTLQPGNISETVTGTSETPMLQTDRSEIA